MDSVTTLFELCAIAGVLLLGGIAYLLYEIHREIGFLREQVGELRLDVRG